MHWDLVSAVRGVSLLESDDRADTIFRVGLVRPSRQGHSMRVMTQVALSGVEAALPGLRRLRVESDNQADTISRVEAGQGVGHETLR